MQIKIHFQLQIQPQSVIKRRAWILPCLFKMYYYICAQGKRQDDVFPVSFKGHTVYMYIMLTKDCLSSLPFIKKVKLRTQGHQRFVLKS